jgi:hypothetical protein
MPAARCGAVPRANLFSFGWNRQQAPFSEAPIGAHRMTFNSRVTSGERARRRLLSLPVCDARALLTAHTPSNERAVAVACGFRGLCQQPVKLRRPCVSVRALLLRCCIPTDGACATAKE